MSTPRRVMIVDDNEININIIEELLEDRFLLCRASSGEEALAQLAEFAPDLVLLDIMMPGIDGYETCKRIREDEKHGMAKIILVSAKAMTHERLRGYEAGADDYIIKPFDHDELQAKVNIFLRLKRAEELDGFKQSILKLINHEVRTPLSAIVQSLELIEGGDEGTDNAEFVGYAKESCLRLIDFTEKACLYGELIAGKAFFEPAPSPVGDCLSSALSCVESAAAEKGVELVVCRDGADAVCAIDGDYLPRAIQTLIDNAIEHSEPGAQVHVSLVEDEGKAVLSVCNYGVPIDPDTEKTLFEGLISASIDHHQKGLCLSLALAKEIVELHGGDLSLVRSDAEGTLFELRLPISRAAADTDETEPASPEAEALLYV